MHKPDNLLTVAETAERLRISEAGVKRRFRAGDLPRVKIGHRTLVRDSDVTALIARSVQLSAAA